MECLAYDYDKQQWVEGADAAKIRVSQVYDELGILLGPGAGEYLRNIGSELTPPEAIGIVRKELNALLDEYSTGN